MIHRLKPATNPVLGMVLLVISPPSPLLTFPSAQQSGQRGRERRDAGQSRESWASGLSYERD